jgi:hypothetical protein
LRLSDQEASWKRGYAGRQRVNDDGGDVSGVPGMKREA